MSPEAPTVVLAGAVAADLAGANLRLYAVVSDLTRAHLIDGAARARAVVRLSSDERYESITADELRLAAEAFLHHVERAG